MEIGKENSKLVFQDPELWNWKNLDLTSHFIPFTSCLTLGELLNFSKSHMSLL